MIENLNRWKGFKEVKVYKIVQEDKNVKSFYIKSLDNNKLPEFIAGQFISVRIKNEDGSVSKPKQYTLSMNYNGEFYRISVKREEEGNISKKLCDEVRTGDILEITAPLGKFVLKDNNRPVVLIGGGIGITPMLTMAYDLKNSDKDVRLIYSIPNENNHSFEEEINSLAKEKNITETIFYTRPTENSDEDKFHHRGRMTKEWMEENLPKDAEFYFCGPIPFMKSIYKNLVDMGVDTEEINYELFGPGEDIRK